ncbi:MAG: arylsulfatase, partial [Planctomycetota bacterium]|nr:arylsulfatase [Planctomycetota bacterium]MEC9096110.1 arylsulfatase [Planctomycetota bacterium]
RQGSWKYIPVPGSGGWGKGGDPNQPIQLYNLATDIGETNNLAAQQPDRVTQMQDLLETLINRGRSTPGARQKNDVKVRRYPAKTANPKQN